MQVTANGEDGGVVDRTRGWDPAPVYKTHLENLSVLDYYRMELLDSEYCTSFGYRPHYYNFEQYSKAELKQLFAVPFKVEISKYSKWPNWPNAKIQKEYHAYFEARIDNLPERIAESDRYKTDTVICLFPKLQPGQKLYE